VSAAVARQIERDKLNEIIEAAEAETGPITAAELEESRQELERARLEHGTVAHGAA
jgi:hypothetical protein